MRTLETLALFRIILKTSNFLSKDFLLLWFMTRLFHRLTTLGKIFDFKSSFGFWRTNLVTVFSQNLVTVIGNHSTDLRCKLIDCFLCHTNKIVIVASLFIWYIYLVLFYSYFDFYWYSCFCFIIIYYYLYLFTFIILVIIIFFGSLWFQFHSFFSVSLWTSISFHSLVAILNNI